MTKVPGRNDIRWLNGCTTKSKDAGRMGALMHSSRLQRSPAGNPPYSHHGRLESCPKEQVLEQPMFLAIGRAE